MIADAPAFCEPHTGVSSQQVVDAFISARTNAKAEQIERLFAKGARIRAQGRADSVSRVVDTYTRFSIDWAVVGKRHSKRYEYLMDRPWFDKLNKHMETLRFRIEEGCIVEMDFLK